MSLKAWAINGLSLELDLLDYENVKRYEEATEAFQNALKAAPEDGKASDHIKFQCDIIRTFFEHIFGTDTTDKLFESTSLNSLEYIKVYESFIQFVTESSAERRTEFDKYLPNRQQRHSAVKKKK